MYGGFNDISTFWSSEIICDFGAYCFNLLVAAHVIGSLLLLTKYRLVTTNRALRIIQDRFFFVGWDVFVVIDALGLDPWDERLVYEGTAMTSCTFASLLQQLYSSGPSGLVQFAGDHVFKVDKEHSTALATLRYAPEEAEAMGFELPPSIDVTGDETGAVNEYGSVE
ncbi:TPA: hypothetical protein N0F65_003228 [Lagenidium giganteum]|uniref:Uncharacterized protein n=1 Tax=Lagenidium giganteum TaxID=4803 RepID=A0AAV2ZAY1_9STRA|nr:TPA: hypothetical protein N0F65_003228 [Lagenidium giganteum]